MVRNSLIAEQYGSTGCLYDMILVGEMTLNNEPGTRTVQLLRSLEFNGLVVGIVNHPQLADIHEFIEAGADFVIAKPLNLDKFKQHVRGVTDNEFSCELLRFACLCVPAHNYPG